MNQERKVLYHFCCALWLSAPASETLHSAGPYPTGRVQHLPFILPSPTHPPSLDTSTYDNNYRDTPLTMRLFVTVAVLAALIQATLAQDLTINTLYVLRALPLLLTSCV